MTRTKTKNIILRVSETEEKEIADRAQKRGMSVSAYLRFQALQVEPSVKK